MGNRISMSISAARTAVSYGPRWNWWMSTARSPCAAADEHLGADTSQTADRSSAGSAWQSEPPIVPRLRTTGSAITFSAS